MTTTTKFTPRPLKRVARCVSTATLEFYIPREESGPSEERLALRRLLQYGCTRCLTPAQQQLTRLRYTDGLTVTAIAEQMGLAPSSVSRSLGVIRQRLYRFTEEAGESAENPAQAHHANPPTIHSTDIENKFYTCRMTIDNRILR